MQQKCEKLDSANGKITLSVSKGFMDGKIEKLANKYAKEMKMDGFRAGKIPLAVVKTRLKDRLAEEARQTAISEAMQDGLKQLGIAPDMVIGQPLMTKFEENADGGFDAQIDFSLKPQIALKAIESMIPEAKTEKVTAKEVDERIKSLAKAALPAEKIEENRAVKNGDFVLIDFAGKLDGEEVKGAKAESHLLEIGSGSFVPGFEDALVGAKCGGKAKKFTVTFPEDYGNAQLAGKPVEFEVTVKEIRVKPAIELNDELAKKMLPADEEATLEKVKEMVKEEILKEKRAALYNETLKPQLIENLLAGHEFDLPGMIVEQELDLLLQSKLRSMSESEIEELRDNQEKVKEIRESLLPEAQKSVKATFLIDEIARAESIIVEDNELLQAIYYEAMGAGMDPQQMFEYYKSQGLLPAVKMAMIEDRLLTHLLDKKGKVA